MNTAISWSALVAGLVALLAGGLLAASILRPLHRVEQAVAASAQGDLTARVETGGRDEIGRLAAGVNQMAAAVGAAGGGCGSGLWPTLPTNCARP